MHMISFFLSAVAGGMGVVVEVSAYSFFVAAYIFTFVWMCVRLNICAIVCTIKESLC